MLRSNADLKERLAGWTSWDLASYHVGANLGFWPDMGAPPGEDHWYGAKGIIWSANPLGDAIANFLEGLVSEGLLERRDEPEIEFRWNPNYKGLDR